MQTVTTFNMKSPFNACYQRMRENGGIIPSPKSGGPIPLSSPALTPMSINTGW